LQRQHHAGEDRGQPDHRQRVVAHIDDLAQDQPGIERRAHSGIVDPIMLPDQLDHVARIKLGRRGCRHIERGEIHR
jgi:hypothetical protein